MAATTSTRNTERAGQAWGRGTALLAPDAHILRGTIVTIDPSTRLASSNPAHPAVGIALATATEGITDRVEYEYGIFGLLRTGAEPHPGQAVFTLDNQTVNVSSAGGTRGLTGVHTETRGVMSYIAIAPWITGVLALNEDITALEGDVTQLQSDVGDLETAVLGLQGASVTARTFAFDHDDFDAAALTQAINAGAVMAAGAVFLGASLNVTEIFGGGAVSDVVIDVGVTGNADALIADADGEGVAVTNSSALLPASAAQPIVTITTTGGNVVALTTGEATLTLYYFVPAAE
jgi:hypothetical protein